MVEAKTKSRPRIGVFDSGVGGLSILAALQSRMPQATFVYAADNAHFPYGTKSRDEVIQLTVATVRAMLKRAELDIIVIACNTASTAALKYLRERFPVEFVGVVPAVKPAAAETKTGCIGLLATPTTIAGDYTSDLIANHAASAQVVLVGSRRLVELAELKLRGIHVALDEVRAEISPLFNQQIADKQPADKVVSKVDTVVLGCTHFPLLIEELKAASPWPVKWIDSGKAVASRVADVMKITKYNAQASDQVAGCVFLATTLADTESLQPALQQYGFASIEFLSLSP